MSDHTTSAARRIAGAILAATTSIVPFALWASTGPAGAEPGPLEITNANPCELRATGAGYDELAVTAAHPSFGIEVERTTDDTISVEYGQWLVPNDGSTIVLTVQGIVGGNVVASQSITTVTCLTSGALDIEVAEVGPAPAGATYVLGLYECGTFGGGLVNLAVTGGADVNIPVIPGVEYCPWAFQTPAGMAGGSWSHDSFVVTEGIKSTVTYTADWSSTRVALDKLFVVDGGAVDPASVGVDVSDVHFTWTSRDQNGTVTADGSCGMDVGTTSLECDQPRIEPGGTIEVIEAGAAGWVLQESTFGYDECSMVDTDGGTRCQLTLVNEPVPGQAPSAVPAAPAAPAAPTAPVAAPAGPAAPTAPAAPATQQADAAAEVRAALPRTGADGRLAAVGTVLAAAGAGLLGARRRFVAER